MSKKLRQQIYDKYNGLCAYTGKPLDDKWQIDHGISKHVGFYKRVEVNGIDNLYPAIRIINHYKKAQDIEQFRHYMSKFHIRLGKLPKKTSVERTVKRKEYMYRIAELFDITTDKPFCGTFYFETISCKQTT